PLRLFKWNNLLHLIPFFYILLVKTMSTILPDLHLPEFFMPFFVSQPILHGVVQLISIVVYSLASIRLIERYKTGLKQEELIINLVQLKWLKQCIQVVLFSVIGIIIAIKVLWFVYPAHTNWRLVFSGLTILIYWISYKALSNPGIFHFHSNELKLVDYPSHQIMNNNIEVTSTVKYYNSRLGEDQLSDILSSLEELMEQHKLYTDPQITIELLSLRLKISRHHLSQAINDKLNKNFNEFINEYRVKEAMRLLKDTQFDQYTIASIAYSSGFNSLASFNNSFKKYSGITPSGFKKERLSAH
ncbi:MAG TPA: AraC family transcriptional regulator, partial [Saprospiraceae bacterium]|nr:AraC family transcriptional regulator [Saprospiraceae bacterium]